jgi:ABC-type antimicrobial peptide transport system permease subunit
VGIGTAVGLALALAAGRLVTSMLFGVQPLDPLTLAAVIAVLATTAALSIAGPAWRAARIDPVAALRDGR